MSNPQRYRERELFADSGTFRRCQLCDCKLSTQQHCNQKTKLFGLCFLCLQDFERCGLASVDTFLKSSNRCRQIDRRRKVSESRRLRTQAWLRQEHAEIQARRIAKQRTQ